MPPGFVTELLMTMLVFALLLVGVVAWVLDDRDVTPRLERRAPGEGLGRRWYAQKLREQRAEKRSETR